MTNRELCVQDILNRYKNKNRIRINKFHRMVEIWMINYSENARSIVYRRMDCQNKQNKIEKKRKDLHLTFVNICTGLHIFTHYSIWIHLHWEEKVSLKYVLKIGFHYCSKTYTPISGIKLLSRQYSHPILKEWI